MTHAVPDSSKGATLPLLKTVFQSILEVFILCFAGWILARRNLLDKKTQKKLNILNINLFTPALLFSKVAFFLSPAKLKELWIVPLIFVIVTLTSWVVSWGLAKACRLKKTQRSFAIAASMFMNSNSLPIALMQSLVVTVHGLKWGKDDTRDGMLGRSLTYLVLHSTLGMMLRWSYGVRLLAQADDEPVGVLPPPTPIVHSPPESSERSPLLADTMHYRDYSSTTLRSQGSVTSIGDDAADDSGSLTAADRFRKSMMQRSSTSVSAPAETVGIPGLLVKPPTRPPMVNKRSHFFYSFPNTPNMSHTSLPPSRVQSPPPAPPTTVSRLRSNVSNAFVSTKSRMIRFWKGFREFMTPPLYSALASLIVACIPPLQHMLDVHMPPVKGAINMAGNCSIPITLIVLGGYFWRGDGSDEANQPAERLKTDLPQQRITAAPERVYTSGTRAQPNAAHLQGSHSAEPTGLDVEVDQREMGRPVSDATTLVGASTSTAGASWEGLKKRFKTAKSSDHLDSDVTRGENGVDGSIPQPIMTKKDDHKGEARTVLVAILSRMVITPMIILPIMALVMTQTTMRLFDDPVFVVANVLFVSSPPALTLAQITQAASGDAFERLISKTIFWSYCVVTPITTIIYVFLGMELAKL